MRRIIFLLEFNHFSPSSISPTSDQKEPPIINAIICARGSQYNQLALKCPSSPADQCAALARITVRTTGAPDGAWMTPNSRLDSTGIYTLQAVLQQMLGDDAALVGTGQGCLAEYA